MDAGQWYRVRMAYVSETKLIEWTIDGCETKLLAKDGIYLNKAPRDFTAGVMTSGNRADILIRCQAPGQYTIKSNSLTELEGGTARENDLISGDLMYLDVVAPPTPAPKCEPSVFSVNRPCYLVDLVDVEPTSPPMNLTMGPVDEYSTSFNTINDVVWDDYDNHMFSAPVGTVQQFDVMGTAEHHPIHIHLNPYQMVNDMDGVDFTHLGYFDKGDWQDTLLLPDPSNCDEYIPNKDFRGQK